MYERTVDGQTLSLGNLGVTVDRALAMYDAETGSSWNQATGIAMTGHYTGTPLRPLAASTTGLGAWLASYPNSGVLAPTTEFSTRQNVRFWDPAQAESTLQVVRVGAAVRAYPLARFPESGLLQDVLGDEPIALLLGRQPKILAAYSRRVGDEVIELDAHPVTDDIELRERGGTRRWSAISGRSRPLRSARPLRPLRPLSSMPIGRAGFELNLGGVEVFGGPLRPLPKGPPKRERAFAPTTAAPVEVTSEGVETPLPPPPPVAPPAPTPADEDDATRHAPR